MPYPDNISFSFSGFSSEKMSSLTNEQVLRTELPTFIQKTCKMQIRDVISKELFITFVTEAELVSSKEQAKLQRLKVETGAPNTYMVSLRFIDNRAALSEALSGRSTSYKRTLARKLFLAGLSNANYDTGIEKAREDTLYSFSDFIASSLFKPNDTRIQQNVPLINSWLVRLLG